MKKIVLLFLVLLGMSCEQKSIESPLLHRFASFENRFRFFFEDGEGWQESVYQDSIFVNSESKDKISKTNPFVVGYRNGDFVYQRAATNDLPDELNQELNLDNDFRQTVFLKSELETEDALCEVIHLASPIFKFKKDYFQTALKNNSEEKIKVIRFGSFVNVRKNEYTLTTGGYYTATHFVSWYTEDDKEWIEVGETVFDPINRGAEGTLWAYQIQTESGEIYWVSAIREAK